MQNQLQKTNKTSISRGAISPASLLSNLRKAKMFDQLCILVLDGSGSMLTELEDGISKAIATANATKELIHLLQKSSKSPSFSLGVICFADVVETRLHAQSVEAINTDKVNLIPFTKGIGNKTLVMLGLEEAEKMGEAFIKSGEPNSTLKRTVRIILMSDGYAHDFAEAISYADKLRENWADKMRICTSLFGSELENDIDSAEEFLKGIASKDTSGNPYYVRSTSGPILRGFFEKSSTDE
jgi:hypothetical protein